MEYAAMKRFAPSNIDHIVCVYFQPPKPLPAAVRITALDAWMSGRRCHAIKDATTPNETTTERTRIVIVKPRHNHRHSRGSKTCPGHMS